MAGLPFLQLPPPMPFLRQQQQSWRRRVRPRCQSYWYWQSTCCRGSSVPRVAGLHPSQLAPPAAPPSDLLTGAYLRVRHRTCSYRHHNVGIPGAHVSLGPSDDRYTKKASGRRKGNNGSNGSSGSSSRRGNRSSSKTSDCVMAVAAAIMAVFAVFAVFAAAIAWQ